MADKNKFIRPIDKKYSVRDMLTQERMQESTQALRKMQTILWKSMDDDAYEEIERTFDTAIASMMAHMLEIDVQEIRQRAGQETMSDVATSILLPGA